MEIRELKDVFPTVGLPKYTYIKPQYFGEIRSDIEQVGRHLLIEGPSGIGKSCVIYKVFEELGWEVGKHFIYKSCRDDDAQVFMDDFLVSALTGSNSLPLFVADDFHFLPPAYRVAVGSKLKQLSDRAFEQPNPAKVALIGIPASGGSILSNAGDLGPRLGSYRIQRATDPEIGRLIDEGEAELNVIFENRDSLLNEIGGNFWLAQYICGKVCATNDVHKTQLSVEILDFKLDAIRKRLTEELSTRFMPTACAFAKGKKWRPGGNKPYLEVLQAIIKIPELVIPFDSVLSVIPERRRPGIKAVKSRIREVLYNPSKAVDLRKSIAFEESYFSIEDPLFRYFLTNMDVEVLNRELGITAEKEIYSYDIGFSFASEVRALVEQINEQLKDEDAITFYDYDQQAFLLGVDLQSTLARIYSESCKYYLVFLEAKYLEKVWTRFESDIMTRAGREKHIIPVVLEAESQGKVVGISSSLGMIDLTAEWKEILAAGVVSRNTVDAIHKKVVLPLSEKMASASHEV